MTDQLDWEQVREQTIDRFQGQTPRAQDEAPIVDVFETHPQLVLRAIDETAQALAEGKITWAWSILAKRIDKGTTAIRNAKADVSGDKQRRIDNAKTWIHNAGIYYDREQDIRAELFGSDHERGRLADLDLTDAQREDLVAYWQQQRPRGIQAEADSEAWQAECAGNRQRVTEILKRKKRELEAAQTATPDAAVTADNTIEW